VFALFYLFIWTVKTMVWMSIRLIIWTFRLTYWLARFIIAVTPAMIVGSLTLIKWVVQFIGWLALGGLTAGRAVSETRRNRAARTVAAPAPTGVVTVRPAGAHAAPSAALPAPSPSATVALPAPTLTGGPESTLLTAEGLPIRPRRADARRRSARGPESGRPEFRAPRVRVPAVPAARLVDPQQAARVQVNHGKAARRGKIIGFIAVSLSGVGACLITIGMAGVGETAGGAGVMFAIFGIILGLVGLGFTIAGHGSTVTSDRAAARLGLVTGLCATAGVVVFFFGSAIILGIVSAATGHATTS